MSNPDDRDGIDEHRVEDHAKVYLVHAPEGWVIDRVTLDGSPLTGIDDGPECDINHDYAEATAEELAAYEVDHAAAEAADLPNAYQLMLLLVEALRNTHQPIHLISTCQICGDLVTEAWMRSDEWQASGTCGTCLHGGGPK